jgi:hypothetical protein
MRRLILSGILSFLLTEPAFCQDTPKISPASKTLLEDFLSSEGYRTFAEIAFNQIEPPPLRAECPHLTIAGNVKLYTPLTEVSVIGESPNRLIANGAWVSVVDFDRCGKTVRRRALMRADDKGAIRPVGLLPGDFRGDLILEHDAIWIVTPTMMASPACMDRNQFFVTDVSRSETKPNGDWTELWTASACGKAMSTEVSYGRVAEGIVVTANAHKQ